MLPIKPLPVLERWACAGCARCCRGSLIWLNKQDLQKLQEQDWHKRSEFAGIKTVVRAGWIDRRKRLAQRADGSCVFLLPDGRCRIHAEFGHAAKPLLCRLFPLQLVPLEKHTCLTLRRACPTAAADQGQELDQYAMQARELAVEGQFLDRPVRAPALTRCVRRDWGDALVVAGTLDRLMQDARFPLVRRLAHGIRFCSLFEPCRLKRFDTARLRELCSILETEALALTNLFRRRTEPSRVGKILFRQIAAEYLRLHPAFVPRATWAARWRLARAAVAVARGAGEFPRFHDGLPVTTFEALERPLGHLEEAVQRPFLQFFVTQVISKQYAVACRPGWPLIESFRALALAYPVGLWLLRLLATNQTPTAEHAVDIVTMLDRGQHYAPLTSSQHRSRTATLARTSELEKLTAWYAR